MSFTSDNKFVYPLATPVPSLESVDSVFGGDEETRTQWSRCDSRDGQVSCCSPSAQETNSQQLSELYRIISGGEHVSGGSVRSSRRKRRASNEELNSVHRFHSRLTSPSASPTRTSGLGSYWKNVTTGICLTTEHLAHIIFESIQGDSRGTILQDIVCERRNPDNPRTMETLQERLQSERFNSHPHCFVFFSGHRLLRWEHTHTYHDCSYRKSWCSYSIM